MASDRHIEAFISYKLTFLKDRGDLFISAVGHYVNEIIAAGESWTEKADNKVGYLELCHRIDSAVLLLCEKYGEFIGASENVATNQLSSSEPTVTNQLSSNEQTERKSQSTTETVYKQPAAPLASATPSYRSTSEPVLPADEAQLKPILARIAVIEEAMCSFRGNAETVAKQQSCIDQQLKELLSKQSETEKINNSKFKKVKKQISEISDTQVSLDQELEARLQHLEEQLQELSTSQRILTAEMESKVELREKFVHLPDQLESIKGNLDVLEARICRIIDDCSNNHHDTASVSRDLTDKVMANMGKVQIMCENQEQKTILLRELETRLQTLESVSGKHEKDVQKQVEKAEANFRILCQMLHNRLTPLEQLRTYLNQRASKRDNNIKRSSQVIKKVAVMSPRIQQLELKSARTRCGFTAHKVLPRQVPRDIIQQYSQPLSNVGGNFNADSGIFTAPVDGLYVVSVSLHLMEDGEVVVSVRYKKRGQDTILGESVLWSSSAVKETSACHMSVVDMKAGDTLFMHLVRGSASCSSTIWLSCFLLA